MRNIIKLLTVLIVLTMIGCATTYEVVHTERGDRCRDTRTGRFVQSGYCR